MGGGAALQLARKGWHIVGYNRTESVTKELKSKGIDPAFSFTEIKNKLKRPRVFWLMLPAGKVVDDIIFGKSGLVKVADKGDIIIDAGNSFYKDALPRGARLKRLGIKFLDAGFSGGPGGVRHGACFMVGGDKKLFNYLSPLFRDLAVKDGFKFFPGVGAGHFVKMIHNGIEYGMMQAIAEGFQLLKKSKYKLNMYDIADIYSHGSVVQSRLVSWLEDGLEIYGDDLRDVSGRYLWLDQRSRDSGNERRRFSFQYRLAKPRGLYQSRGRRSFEETRGADTK